jgi:hypothetical protein
MRERDTSGAKTARPVEVTEADIFRIRKATLDRPTVERVTNSHGRPGRGRG